MHRRLALIVALALGVPLAAEQALPDLATLAGRQEQKFLPPDQAFQFDARVEGTRVELGVRIHAGYYLYRDKTQATLVGDASGATLRLELPVGEAHEDEFFGKQQVLRGDVVLVATLSAPSRGTLRLQYQGCADAGLCYPPQVKLVALADAAEPAVTGADATPEQDRLARVIGEGSLLLVIGVFFVAGLALTFTPCVLPMVPILSGIIAGEGGGTTPARAFGLSLVYVLAMAATYTVAGVLAGLFGQNLQAALQDPWVLGSFATLFVVLSFSMFGYYELQMPAALQERFAKLSNNQRGGTYLGTAVMGLLSALIVGPCVTAPLVGALVYIGQSGDPLRGGLALFALSLGMGVPLLLVGASLGGLLPRAGVWMETVKQAFGVLLLATALWFARTLLPEGLVMVLWGLLALGLGLLLGADAPARGAALTKRVLALALALWGVAILVGAASGSRDPLAPLARLGGAPPAAAEGLAFQRVASVTELDAALAAARAAGQPVLLDFYADWCVACKEMERYTFNSAEVQAALAGVVLLQADLTANSAADQALLARYGLFGPPTTILFGPDGAERTAARAVGFVPATEYAARLRAALGR